MIRTVLFALSLVTICSRAAICETALAQMSRSELRELAASAHSPAEFRRLANYYQHLSIRFAEQSLEQERLWKRELEHPTPGQKYPTAGDCARRLHEYYAEQARMDRQKALSYEQRLQDTKDTAQVVSTEAK